jgi:hypothetical protein
MRMYADRYQSLPLRGRKSLYVPRYAGPLDGPIALVPEARFHRARSNRPANPVALP